MPITSGDILFKLSINDGPGGSEAQADPNDSIGGFISSTEIVDASGENLFDDISGDANANEVVDYRCFFVHNDHESLVWQNVVVWISSEVAGGANAAIAIDGIGASALDSSDPQSERIANDTTAPSGESFSSPTTKGTGLAIGDIEAGEVVAIWVRRTATDSEAQSADGVTIRVEGDTAA